MILAVPMWMIIVVSGLLFWKLVQTLNITLISVTMTDLGSGGFLFRDPSYDILIDLISQSNPALFGNFSHISLRYPNNSSAIIDSYDDAIDLYSLSLDCNNMEDYVSDFLSDFFFKREYLFSAKMDEHFTILTTTDCPVVALHLANFASASSTFLGMTISSNVLANNRRYPTTLNLFAVPDVYFPSTLAILAKKFSWTELNVVFDPNENLLFYSNQRKILVESLRKMKINLAVDFLPLAQRNADFSGSNNSKDVWTSVITKRVSLLLLSPSLLRNSMIEAYRRNLTNGEYIFFAFGVRGRPSLDEVAWKKGTVDNEIALVAFRALLVIRDGSSDWDGAADLNAKLRSELFRRYNWTVAQEELNSVAISRSYEWLLVFVENFTRLLPMLAEMTVADFLRSCANRTYNLPTRSFHLDEKGAMVAPVSIVQVDSSGIFQTIMSCNVLTQSIQLFNISLNWFGNNTLPGDFPECGLNGERCMYKQSIELVKINLPIAFVTGMAIFIMAGFFVRKRTSAASLLHIIIGKDELTASEEKDAVSSSPANSFQNLRFGLLGLPATYRNNKVFVKPIMPLQLHKKLTRAHERRFLMEVVKVSLVRHHYLAELYGVSLEGTIFQMIYERPSNKSIRTILKESAVFRDLELQLTLLVNLVQGVDFIHTSDLKYHGNLNSELCLLNDRYTIRIAQAGFTHLTNTLDNYQAEKDDKQKREAVRFCQQNDILALGHILTEIFDDQATVSIDKKYSGRVRKVALSPKEIIESCINPDPLHRPNASDLKAWVRMLGLSGKNIVELLLYRLQKHAVELEDEVAERSTDLLEERNRLDGLLNEMLPKSIISQLRNNETIVAELFESATVLFSDIPVFPRLVAECQPLDVIAFLGQIHTAYDRVVTEFDAYKVETINDSYVVVSGVPARNETRHADVICRLALSLRISGSSLNIPSWGNISVCPRIGINSGQLAAGVVGSRMPRYCLFGDTMNTASRMESHGAANKIHTSASTRDLAQQYKQSMSRNLVFIARGKVAIKGKGMIETFWLEQ